MLWEIAVLIFLSRKSWVTPLGSEEALNAVQCFLSTHRIIDDNLILNKHIEIIRDALPGKSTEEGVDLYGCGSNLASQLTQARLIVTPQNTGCEIKGTFFSIPSLAIFVLALGITLAISLLYPLALLLGGGILFCLYLAFQYTHRMNISHLGKTLLSEVKATT